MRNRILVSPSKNGNELRLSPAVLSIAFRAAQYRTTTLCGSKWRIWRCWSTRGNPRWPEFRGWGLSLGLGLGIEAWHGQRRKFLWKWTAVRLRYDSALYMPTSDFVTGTGCDVHGLWDNLRSLLNYLQTWDFLPFALFILANLVMLHRSVYLCVSRWYN